MNKTYRAAPLTKIEKIFQNSPLRDMPGLKEMCLKRDVPVYIEETMKLLQLEGCATGFVTDEIMFDFEKSQNPPGYAKVLPICWKEILCYMLDGKNYK